MPQLWKRCLSMKSENLSLKNIISKSDFLMNAVIIQWNTWKKKKKIVVACKEIKIPEKILDPCNPKEHDQWFI